MNVSFFFHFESPILSSKQLCSHNERCCLSFLFHSISVKIIFLTRWQLCARDWKWVLESITSKRRSQASHWTLLLQLLKWRKSHACLLQWSVFRYLCVSKAEFNCSRRSFCDWFWLLKLQSRDLTTILRGAKRRRRRPGRAARTPTPWPRGSTCPTRPRPPPSSWNKSCPSIFLRCR